MNSSAHPIALQHTGVHIIDHHHPQRSRGLAQRDFAPGKGNDEDIHRHTQVLKGTLRMQVVVGCVGGCEPGPYNNDDGDCCITRF